MTRKTYLQFIGVMLREERLRQGITQQDLAERVGLSRTQVTNIEAGRGVSVTAIMDLSHALGYRVEVQLAPNGGKMPKAVNPVTALLSPHKSKLKSAQDRLAAVSKVLEKVIREIG